MPNSSIEALYFISCTPHTINDKTSLALHKIFDHCEKNNIDNCHIENIIFFANLLGVDTDLSGLALIKQQLQLLIKQCCAAADLPAGTESSLDTSIAIMRHIAPKLKEKVPFLKLTRGYKSITPIFAFHIAGASEANTLNPNYIKFAFEINKLLRHIEKEVPERLEEAARILRYFLNSRRVEADYLSAKVVKAALTEIATARNWDSATLKQREDFADKMFGTLEPPEARGGGYTRNTYSRHYHVDNIYVTEDEDNYNKKGHHSLRLNKTYSLPKAAAREGESIDDYPQGDIILPFPSPFLTKQTHLDIPLSVLNYFTFTFPWDRRSLRLYEISLLFYFLFDGNFPLVDNIVTRAFLENALFLGLGFDDLITLNIGRAKASGKTTTPKQLNSGKESEPIKLFFSPDSGSVSYTIPEKALGYYADTTVSRNCLASGTVVELKLPQSMRHTFNEIIKDFAGQRRGVSSHLLFPQEVRAECYAEVKRFIRNFNATFEMSLTKESLTRSFKSYFQARYRCDPVCVSYFSATLDSMTRTQRFYRRLEPEELHREYYRCYNSFRSDIYNNLIEISKVDNSINPYRSLEYLAGTAEIPSSTELIDFVAFGSRVVPSVTALRDFFTRITTILESYSLCSLQQRCDYHNLFTTFSYVALQLGSGLRPIADPLINFDTIDSSSNFIYVADKDSPTHVEGRIICVPRTAIEILKHLAVGAKRIMELLRPLNSKNNKRPNKLLYFILPDFNVVDVTPERLRVVLNKHGLAELYDYPLNCMRHLLRSTLPSRGAGACSDLVDALMGHLHHGKGILDMYSASSAEALRLVAELIEGIMEELNVRAVTYRLQPA